MNVGKNVRENVMKKLLILVLFFSCATTYEYSRQTEKQIDTYYSKTPDVNYSELQMINVVFEEKGILTGKGSSEILTIKLQDKAAELNADAIMDIKIEADKIPRTMNSIWKASAIAIKYN